MRRILTYFLIGISVFLTGNLYAQSRIWGTVSGGMESGIGGIFSINPDGNYFEVNSAFGENPGSRPAYCDILHASNGKMYGTTQIGGTFDVGVIFQFDTAGNKYKAIYIFDKLTGAYPHGSLIQAKNGRLYGMTSQGGKYNHGVIFSYHIDSARYKVVHHFRDSATGAQPYGDLVEASNGLLYGMCSRGGKYNKGVIFSYSPVKDQVVKRFSFNDTLGAEPKGSLTPVGKRLYGVTRLGGNNTGRGAIFSIDTSTYKVTRYYSFGSQTGEYPMGRLIMANNGRLYGVATAGGQTPGLYPGTSGTVFSIDTSSHTFSVIRQFSGIASVTNPVGSLVKLGNGKLYGTCSYHINSPNKGGIYSIRPTSTYKVEKNFVNDEPASVASPLSILAPGKLIGLAQYGGVYINRGVIYTFDTATKTTKNLIEFSTQYGGSNGNGSLTQGANGLLYGATQEGGADKMGVLFSVNPKTSQKKILHDFKYSGGKGMNPRTKLLQTTDGRIWGVTARGGANNSGTIFSWDTSKNAISWEYEFQGGSGGTVPVGNLVTNGSGLFYGITYQGGNNSVGILYSWHPASKTFTKLADFNDTATGSYPTGYLTMTPAGKILGMSHQGGKNSSGTIFTYNPKDSTLKTRVHLSDTGTGSLPWGGLTRGRNGLYYGMTEYGGDFNAGTIFSYNDSTGKVLLLHSFLDSVSGAYPKGNLTQYSSGLWYGMTTSGGTYSYGTIFCFNADSGAIRTIFHFNGTNGASPGFGELTEVFTEPNRWTGKKDSLWSELENWTQKRLPSEVQLSVVPGKLARYPIIAKPSSAGNLVVDSGAVVTVGAGASLTINNRLTNNGTVQIMPKGSLLPGAAYEQTGKGVYRIYRSNSWKDSTDYSLWSSPVALAKGSSLPGNTSRKYKFNAGGKSMADRSRLNQSDTLAVCRGYMAGGDTVKTVQITGTVNNGNLFIPVKKDTGLRVFNLIGNPYPGSISALQLIDRNSTVLDKVVYVRVQPSDSSKFCNDDLVAINESGASGGGVKDTAMTLRSVDIGPATGFFTVALKTDTVRFNNSLRNGKVPVISVAPADLKKLTLTLTAPDKYYSQTMVGFSQSATGKYDAGLDAYSLRFRGGVYLYSLLDKVPMAIQSLDMVDSSGSFALGIHSGVKGRYTLQLKEGTPFDYFRVWLADKDSSKLYDLKKGAVSITLDSGKAYTQRFSLKLDRILPAIQVVRNRVCKGDTAVFSVKQPNSLFRYQWIFEGKAGAADTLSTFRVTRSGKLILKQTYRDNSSDQTPELNVYVYDLPKKPALKRSVAVITAGSGYSSYRWYLHNVLIKDSVRSALNIRQPGGYACTVSDTAGCINFSDTLQMPKVEVRIVQNNLCPGKTAEAQVKTPESGFRYTWIIDGKVSTKDSTQTLYLTSAADIAVIMTNGKGYYDTSATGQIRFKTLPSKPVLSQSPGLLQTPSTYTTYQWFRNTSVLSGKTGQTIYYPSSGSYHCVVSNSDGCERSSDTVTISKVAIREILNDPCSGDTARFEIMTVKSGFRYLWTLDGTGQKGDTGMVYTTTKAGILRLIEYNGYGFRDTATTVKVTIRPRPTMPTITLKDAKLDAGTGYTGYRWSRNGSVMTGDSTRFCDLRDTGSYRCLVSNKEGCTISSAMFQVRPAVVRVLKNNVCMGDSAGFEIVALRDGFHYRWVVDQKVQTNDSTQRYWVKGSAMVRLLEYNHFGFSDTSIATKAQVFPLPVAPVPVLQAGRLEAGGAYTTYTWYRNGNVLTGMDSAFCPVRLPGDYRCRVTNAYGCEATSAVFSIKPATIQVIKNPVCEPEYATFRLLGKKTGFTYTWYLDGKPQTVPGDTLLQTQSSGILLIIESNAYGYQERTDSIDVLIKPLPSVQMPVFSNGILDAGQTVDTYQWYKDQSVLPGQDSRFTAPTGPGSYHVTLGLLGCTANSQSYVFKRVAILAIKDTFCSGDSAILKVSNPDTAFKYSWLKDGAIIPAEQDTGLTLAAPGNIQVVKQHAAGYRDTSEKQGVRLLPDPAKPVLTKKQLTLNAGGPYSTYQWYRNQVLMNGETTQTLTISSTGDYHCRVSNASGCSVYSDTLSVTNLFAADIRDRMPFTIFPNPSGDEAYIRMNHSGRSTISVYDMHGRELLRNREVLTGRSALGLNGLPAGMYLVRVECDGTIYHSRVVKNE